MKKLFRSMLSLLLIIALVGSNAAFGACFTASAASSSLQVLTSGVVPSMRIQYDLPYKLGGAGTHVRLADNPINVFRFNGQMAYCIEPDGYTQDLFAKYQSTKTSGLTKKRLYFLEEIRIYLCNIPSNNV